LRLEVKENQIFDSSTTGIGRAMSASSNRLRFTIDDFGRGYSSFGYLRDLDVHSLKLDAGIVADIADNPVSDAFVRGLVEIVRELSFELVVKGVESETQYRCLSELGCLSFQGFHLGRPGPIAAIVQ